MLFPSCYILRGNLTDPLSIFSYTFYGSFPVKGNEPLKNSYIRIPIIFHINFHIEINIFVIIIFCIIIFIKF